MANDVTVKETRFSVAIREAKYQELINNTLGDPATAKKFIADITSVVANNYTLQKCTTPSIISGALTAQSLNLPLAANLGYCYLVPYKNNQGYSMAQFQMGYKGLIQLCIRSNQYEVIGVKPVHKGEVVGLDEFGDDIIKFDHKFDNEEVVGYYAYFKLISGFKKTLYWTKEMCQAHGKKYSKAYGNGSDFDNWTNMFDTMAMKTVLKQLLSKYGIMSPEIVMAVQADQAVVKENGTFDYVDNPTAQETKEDTEEVVVKQEAKELFDDKDPF